MVRRIVVSVMLALGLAACSSAVPTAHGNGVKANRSGLAPADARTPTTSSTTTTTPPPTTTTTAGYGTQQIDFQPFSGTQLAAGLSVTASDTGPCDPYGGGNGSTTYYRCLGTRDLSGHTSVYDPCFAGPKGVFSALACPIDPTTHHVVLFTATSEGPAGPPTAIDRPWAMQLQTGQVCLFTSGAWGGLGPYACSSSLITGPTADCHVPVSGSPWWTAPCQVTEADSSPFNSVELAKVWF